jgi:hypothetical protein
MLLPKIEMWATYILGWSDVNHPPIPTSGIGIYLDTGSDWVLILAQDTSFQ